MTRACILAQLLVTCAALQRLQGDNDAKVFGVRAGAPKDGPVAPREHFALMDVSTLREHSKHSLAEAHAANTPAEGDEAAKKDEATEGDGTPDAATEDASKKKKENEMQLPEALMVLLSGYDKEKDNQDAAGADGHSYAELYAGVESSITLVKEAEKEIRDAAMIVQ